MEPSLTAVALTPEPTACRQVNLIAELTVSWAHQLAINKDIELRTIRKLDVIIPVEAGEMRPAYLQSKTVVHKNFDAFLIQAESTCEFVGDLCGVWSVVNDVPTTFTEKICGIR